MLDVDTFLTTLYVIADYFCQSRVPTQRQRPAPRRLLAPARWLP